MYFSVLSPSLNPPIEATGAAAPPLVCDHSLEESVRQSILGILSTAVGERPLAPDFGSNIQSFVFRRLDAPILRQLEEHVRECIQRWEPRIDVQESQALLDSEADASRGIGHKSHVVICIKYEIRSTRTRHQLRLPLRLWESLGGIHGTT